VTFIHEDRSGMLWLGTFGGGLNRFDPEHETFSHYQHNTKDPYSLSNDIIMSIYEDTTGAIWVATYGGIDKYDSGEYQFANYKSDPDNQKDLGNHKVRSIYQDQGGSVWVGTSGGGLSQFNKAINIDIHYLHDDSDPTSISDNDIWAIDQDKYGDLWIATHGGGLNRFIPAKKTFIRYEHDPDNLNTPACDPLYDLVVDEKREVLWIAAYLSGLDKFDIKTETFIHYRYDPGNPAGIVSNWVTTVFVDSKGFVWVGTEAGLSRFNPKTERFTNFKHVMADSKSLSANMIQSIYEDSRNTIWIGTSDGLNKYDDDTHSFQRYSEKHGLAGNHVAGIIEDNIGYLWISTDKGLSKFNPQDVSFRNYNKHDGLQGNRFLMHSVHKNITGELFFGGVNGFNVFNPNKLNDNQHIPTIIFTDFQLFNESVSVEKNSVLTQHINQSKQINLNYDQDVFSIEFTALNFRNSQKNEYAYKMKGFDKNYTYTDSNKRSITYTNLNPGPYIFHVTGSNNDGVWNKKGASIEIVVAPPWWKTLWFKGAVILIGITFIFGIVRIKTHSVQKLNLRLEKQVAERTKELKTWLENSPICTKIVDLDFNLQFMSSAGINGLKIGDIKPFYGKPYPFDFYPESFNKLMRMNLKKVKETSEIIKQEGLVVDIRGEELWFHSTLVPVTDDKDQIEYIIIASVDITERIQVKEALQKAHTDLENKVQIRTAELTKEITERKKIQKVFNRKTHDLGERIKEINCLYSISNLFELQDISMDELFQKIVNLMSLSWQYPEITCSRIVFDKQEYLSDNFKESAWKQNISILVDGKKKGEAEVFYLEKMPELDEGPFLNEERDLINEIAERIGQYIERKQADENRYRVEEKLKESEEKYRSMMESMDEAVYICSPDFHIEYMNPAMIKRTGYNASGESCHKVMHGLDEKCPWCVIEKVTLGESINYEIVSPKDDRIYNISNSPIFHNDGSISKLTMFRDITKIKKMEQNLQQSQKMESIGTLAGGIAHDFNNILFPIVGHSEMLLEDVAKDSPFQEGLNEIYTGALRAKELVKQILTFSRQENNELKLMKMQPIVKEALKLIRSSIPATIEIKQDLDVSCKVIKADPTQIHQIVMNLATNAYHAMEEAKGVIKVILKEIELTKLDLLNPDMKPGTYNCLTVMDTGIGMNKDLLEKIFDPFFTTKDKKKGTGMGLSVTHGIVKSMAGAIQVKSEPGKGTEFNVYFPVEKKSYKKSETIIEEHVPGGTEKILLIDDEIVIIKLVKQVLERLGYQVTSHSHSLEALEAFRKNPNNFDLVITDMAMPTLAGDKLSAELLKIRSEIPILLCTGYSETLSEEEAASLGIKGFLLKPIVMKDISQKIREVLDEN